MSQEQWTSSLRLWRKQQSLQTCAAISVSSSAFSGLVFTIEGMRRLTAACVDDKSEPKRGSVGSGSGAATWIWRTRRYRVAVLTRHQLSADWFLQLKV